MNENLLENHPEDLPDSQDSSALPDLPDFPDLTTHPDPALRELTNVISSSPYWQQLTEQPYQSDLFAVLRWIDSAKKNGPLLGRAARPYFDSVRLGQEPSLTFAASTIASVSHATGARPPQLNIYSFGLFGPNSPLPLHLTEYARDRLRRFNDPTLVRFADIFHHRLILLFYRAWADVQPTVNMDRADMDRFTDHIASLVGYGQPGMRARDHVADHAKLFPMVHFARQTRNPEGLAKALQGYLQIPVVVEEYVPHWITFDVSEQTRLTARGVNNTLGLNAFIGERVLDGQYKIRLRIGPMPLARYRTLLPNCEAIRQITDWVRNYVGLEFIVDVKLILQKDEVPQAQLGGVGQLGWSTWNGGGQRHADADDLVIDLPLVSCHA